MLPYNKLPTTFYNCNNLCLLKQNCEFLKVTPETSTKLRHFFKISPDLLILGHNQNLSHFTVLPYWVSPPPSLKAHVSPLRITGDHQKVHRAVARGRWSLKARRAFSRGAVGGAAVAKLCEYENWRVNGQCWELFG